VLQPLRELHAVIGDTLQNLPEIDLGVMNHLLFFAGHLFVTPTTAEAELAEHLTAKGIAGITIRQGVTVDELSRFIALLARKDLTADQLAKAMSADGLVAIILKRLQPEQHAESDDHTKSDSLATYHQALDAVRGVFKEVETGRIPQSQEIIAAVGNMVTMTIKDPATQLGLTMIKDYDNYTYSHSVNVGILAMTLGEALGLNQQGLHDLGTAGLLHDIGKITIRKNILNKPGKLSAEEFEEMKKHAENGAKIISRMGEIAPHIANAVLGHHIMHDRHGYPEWAKDRSFGPTTDIIAIADCYDAITTLRVYKPPITPLLALGQLRKLAGTYLNGNLVEKFLEMMGKFPVGTLVRLDTNEIAVVFRPNPDNDEAPTVKVIIDASGRKLQEPRVEDLAAADRTSRATIIATVDPLLKNVEVASYFI
jgi:putative nucleotidyltransferase with HDIG domain